MPTWICVAVLEGPNKRNYVENNVPYPIPNSDHPLLMPFSPISSLHRLEYEYLPVNYALLYLRGGITRYSPSHLVPKTLKMKSDAGPRGGRGSGHYVPPSRSRFELFGSKSELVVFWVYLRCFMVYFGCFVGCLVCLECFSVCLVLMLPRFCFVVYTCNIKLSSELVAFWVCLRCFMVCFGCVMVCSGVLWSVLGVLWCVWSVGLCFWYLCFLLSPLLFISELVASWGVFSVFGVCLGVECYCFVLGVLLYMLKV